MKKYNTIFVGAGLISVLEACYRSRCGESILMIDSQKDIGGAWQALNIFGLHDVENAIHYFLPSDHAFNFMRDVLRWEVVTSSRKYRVFPITSKLCWTVPYDFTSGRIANHIKTGFTQRRSRVWLDVFRKIIGEFSSQARQASFYVKGGIPEMKSKIKSFLENHQVELMLGEWITHIDVNSNTVKVTVTNCEFNADTLVISHGSRISNLTGPSGPIMVNEKNHLRPSVHLLVRDGEPTDMLECVFSCDQLIKYAHDVTRITREGQSLAGTSKVLILALQHDVKETPGLFEKLMLKLKGVGMVGQKAVLVDTFWQDAYLPRLEDEDLENIKLKLGSRVEFLKTEDFSRGISDNALRWMEKFKDSKLNESMSKYRDE